MTPHAVSRLAGPVLRGAAHRAGSFSRQRVSGQTPRGSFLLKHTTHRIASSKVPQTHASPSDTSQWVTPTWDVRVLFDGECPLCVREVDFLRARDDNNGRLDLVDIASCEYDPGENRGIDFETAMSTIHGIKKDGTVVTGIPVFEQAYTAVGLGWVYAFTKNETLSKLATNLYDFWAERRLQVTGRPSMVTVMEARKLRERAGGKTACSVAQEKTQV